MDKEKNYSYTGYNPNLKEASRILRKEMTPQEKRLWYNFLKAYPLRFNRQRPIYKFVVDFYCSKAKLIVELDGSQHYTECGIEYDEERTRILEKYGLEVIRFSNYDIDNNFEGVCMEIDRIVSEKINVKKQFSD